MKPKTLTLLILTAVVMASIACGPPPPPEVIVVTATPPPAPAIPSAQDLREQQQTAEMLSKQAWAMVNTDNNAKAIELYSQAIELWPTWRMHFSRGWAYYKTGEYDKACKDFRIAYQSKDKMGASDVKQLETNLSQAC